MTTETMNIEAARELLADHNIEILPFEGSPQNHVNARFLVRVKTGRPQQFPDGSSWDGWEHVGHFEREEDAVSAALDCAKERNGGHL